ncbi:Aldo/keto reductase [Linderina pennispora]|uniref:Aldo/keto reductase n=1 Tax=Linderina pennispora TaxID=61395 RepID=A0A1Y1W9U5_9FUNG|nr:Aldo/keto reductase [Linderina pennispora]ORX70088.1 Aldo/keto reductase [Linderina pennispora]
MSIHKTVKLANGLAMPSLGLGTWQQRDADVVKRVVGQALSTGYQLIDTASVYRNEAAIGDMLTEIFNGPGSTIQRKDIWITSKLAPTQQGYEKAKQAVLDSLEKLQTDYIDLYLIHWPGASRLKPDSPKHREMRAGSWRALEELYEQGKVRSIGVSNFTTRHLDEMKEYAKIQPMVNQCEMHPLCQQTELLQYCAQNSIAFTAYASLGEGALVNGDVKLPQLDAVAARRPDLTPAQILLMWGLQKGVAVIPKASSAGRIQENFDVLAKAELSAQDVTDLDGIGNKPEKHFCWHAGHIA